MDSTTLKYHIFPGHYSAGKMLYKILKTFSILTSLFILGSCNDSKQGIKSDPPSDPPPIIIKSGDFTFEAENLNEPSDTLAKPYSYIINNFQIKSIWVCHYNPIKPDPDNCTEFKGDSKLNIWFDPHTGNPNDPDVYVKQTGNDFVMTVMDKKLTCKNSNNPKRPIKCRRDDVSMQKIEIAGKTYTVTDDDYFSIRFYK